MWVELSPDAPDGILCGSFTSDDWRTCKDNIRRRIGLCSFEPSRETDRSRMAVPAATHDDGECRPIEAAWWIWNEASPIEGTLAEKYLREHRGLALEEDLSHVIRFHARTGWREGENSPMLRVPCLIAAYRKMDGDEIVAIQKTRLAPDATKIARKMFGPTKRAAIKIDRDEDVTYGLIIGEGLETCLSGRLMGFKPCWALGSAGAIGTLPVLAGIDALTLLCETDDSGANARAVEACERRWLDAGREVLRATPAFNGDMNDAFQRWNGFP